MYRDLKPENVLLDEKGNACLADFGISKILDPKQSTKSFVGTPEYVAPEIILQKGHNKTVDIWCFGILLYEMAFGIPPFYNKNQNMMLNWIVKLEPTFPKSIKISDELQSLIIQCLQKDPSKRIGSSDITEIVKHPFFNGVDWEAVKSLSIEPPIKPEVMDKYDTSNFNKEVQKEELKLDEYKEIDSKIISNFEDKFQDFSN